MRQKAVWDPDFHRIFVDLCVEQKLAGNKPRTHFSREGWRNIVKSFQEKTGAGYDRMQLKNHWDTMSKQWKTWCKLVRCSYMKWDPETNKFGASDEDWENYLQENPDAGQYRLGPPQYLEKLKTIFASNGADAMDDEIVGIGKRPRYDNEEEDDIKYEDMKSVCNYGSPQTKGYWSPSTHELFLDLLVQETLKGNRQETHYTKEGWKTILETINEKTGNRYTRAQLKNHWDCTRKSWKIWCQLIGVSSLKWDPETRSFSATEEEWRNYLRINPRASQFRNKQIYHPDKLEIIFRGIIEPGEPYLSPRLKRHLHDPAPLSTHHVNEAAATISPDREDTSLATAPRVNCNYVESQMQEDEAVPIDREAAQRFEGVESRSNITVNENPSSLQMISGNLSYTIGECIECLDATEEVEQGSDLYLFALDMFLKKEYREIFLQLKKPSLRVAWLQRLQSGGPTIA